MARLRICTCVAMTRLIYLHVLWAKDCKYSIQNMLALITDSAVLHMNSELERRGNVSNWLPIHSWTHWLGSRMKTPHRGRKQQLEKDGEGGGRPSRHLRSNKDFQQWRRGLAEAVCSSLHTNPWANALTRTWSSMTSAFHHRKCTQKAHAHKSTIYLANLLIVTND